VWPANQVSVPLIQQLFTDDFQIATSDIFAATSTNFGVNYWEVPLTATQVDILEFNNPLVG